MMRQNRDLEDFFRRVQMTLNNRGGGGGGRFETSQRTMAPATGTTQAPLSNYDGRKPMQPAQGIPSWDRSIKDPGNYSGYIEGMRRLNGGAAPAPRPIQTRQPIPPYTSPGFPSPEPRPMPPYTSPGFPSPEPRPIVYDQIQRGNQGTPGMWNENTGMVNPPAPQQPIQTRQPDPRMRQPIDQYRRF